MHYCKYYSNNCASCSELKKKGLLIAFPCISMSLGGDGLKWSCLQVLFARES